MKYTLELYYYDACYFCRKVIKVINDHDVKVEYFDVLANNDHAIKLFRDTGKNMVPCLYINGSPMHESDDIINFLNTHIIKKT
jgi:glutaredoxin 3